MLVQSRTQAKQMVYTLTPNNIWHLVLKISGISQLPCTVNNNISPPSLFLADLLFDVIKGKTGLADSPILRNYQKNGIGTAEIPIS